MSGCSDDNDTMSWRLVTASLSTDETILTYIVEFEVDSRCDAKNIELEVAYYEWDIATSSQVDVIENVKFPDMSEYESQETVVRTATAGREYFSNSTFRIQDIDWETTNCPFTLF